MILSLYPAVIARTGSSISGAMTSTRSRSVASGNAAAAMASDSGEFLAMPVKISDAVSTQSGPRIPATDADGMIRKIADSGRKIPIGPGLMPQVIDTKIPEGDQRRSSQDL